MSLLIRGGEIVTGENNYQADIFVDGEVIRAIGSNLSMPADNVIDATGLYVMPGGVDPHCHIQMKLGDHATVDDYESSTIAAAYGGTTSIIDIAFQEKGKSLKDALTLWHDKASGKAAIDYTFHAGITDPTDDTLGEMEGVVLDGVPSFKVFTANPGVTMIEDDALLRIFQNAKRFGGMMVVHAENGGFTEELGRQAIRAGNGEPQYWPATRPPETEAEAVHRVIALAEMVDVPVHFYHITSSLAVEEIRKARVRGRKVFAETCPQYLYLTADRLSQPDGAKYMCSPPLRTLEDQRDLWNALDKGALQVVSSDHCAYLFQGQKDSSPNDFRNIPGGLPGVETRMPLVYNGGVADGHLNLNRFVQVVSTNPAKIFGLYPKKGAIAIGSDADLVLWDPKVKWKIQSEKLHMPVDYTPFEDIEVQGAPHMVLSRGQVIVKEGSFVGKVGSGKFIKRTDVNYDQEII